MIALFQVAHSTITGIIFTLGLITVLLSIYSCIKFDRFSQNLSHSASRLSEAISWQLAGEAIIGLGTLTFATAEFFGYLSEWSIHTTSTLRFIMFIATATTTLRLVRVINSLNNK